LKEDDIIKKIVSFIFLIVFAFSVSACSKQEENTCPYAVMIDNEIYYYTDFKTAGDVDPSAILGYITKVVPENEMPDENGEANMDILDAPYAMTDMGMVVHVDNAWTLFETRE